MISEIDVFVLEFAIHYKTNPIHNCTCLIEKSETNRQYSDDLENTTQYEYNKWHIHIVYQYRELNEFGKK